MRIEEAETFHKAPGGAPANVAVALERLGVPAAFIGKVSNDGFGRFLRGTLETEGVDVRALITDSAARTPLAFVGSGGGAGRSFIFYHRGMADTILRCDEVDADLIASAAAFHFGSVTMAAEPGRSATLAAARIARDAGRLVSFDPNVRLELWDSAEEARACIVAALPLADIVKVSGEEIGLLTGSEDPATATEFLCSAGPALAIVTLGGDGCFFRHSGGAGHVPGFVVDFVDALGAGDAFVAGILAAVVGHVDGLHGLTADEARLREALLFANAVGALATTRYGAIPSLPSRADAEAFLATTTAGRAIPGGGDVDPA
jgi:fructokinase